MPAVERSAAGTFPPQESTRFNNMVAARKTSGGKITTRDQSGSPMQLYWPEIG